MLIKPDFIWKVEHFFSVKNGEPTDWYIAGTRIVGTAAIFISVFCAVVFFYLLKCFKKNLRGDTDAFN